MKAILVMEMPESCMECLIWKASFDKCGRLNKATNVYEHGEGYNSRPAWCPLKPMLKRKPNINNCDFIAGWNACIDAIEGSKG